MKQTAVDYLQDEILHDRMIKAKSIKEWNDVISKAKEMERSQMIEFAERLPLKSGLLQEGGTYCERGNVEEYYNKVYGIGAVSEGSNGTSSQTEISDEEIENKKLSNEEIEKFLEWYREQLKNKQ